ncbi:MAG: TonB-dependent receptor domain-containing protein [Flavobacteriaceae bacterium]
MFKNIFTLCFIAIGGLAFAQNNAVKGIVSDNFNNAISGVNVYVKNTAKGTQTDGNGTFELTNVGNGTQTVVLSFIGYKTKEVLVDVLANQTKDLGLIVLFEGNELLQEVVIEGRRDNKFSRKKTAYVSKLPLKDMENPTVYSTITTELLESQVVTNFDDAMNNATGISKLWESTGRAPGEGTSYFSSRGFSVQPQLVNGLPGFTFSAIDPSYIERIEVIKGPAATLFGGTVTSLGGLVNVVTKQPYEGFGGSVSYTAGSFNLHRGSFDINTPLGSDDNIFFRLNASYLTQDSFQDAGFRETFFVAPSLTYRVNNRLNLLFGVEYSQTEQTNPPMLFIRRGMAKDYDSVDDLNIDPEKSFTSNDISLTSPILNTRFVADYKLSDQWTSQTIFASTFSKAKGNYQYVFEGAAAAFFSVRSLLGANAAYVDSQLNTIEGEAGMLLMGNTFARILDYRDANATKANIQQNFTGDFKIGNLRNRLVLGLDYVHREEHSRSKSGHSTLWQTSEFPSIVQTFNFAFPGAGDMFAAQLATFPYFDAFFYGDGTLAASSFTPGAAYSPNKTQLNAVLGQLPIDKIETSSQTFAAYASDVVNITKNLTVNLGLRLDYFDQKGDKEYTEDNFTKTTFSPNAGIVFQPILNTLTLFANYQTGFYNNDPAVSGSLQVDTDNDGVADKRRVTTFEPTKAVQFEGGIKTNFLKGKLNTGISYYHITAKNTMNSEPNTPLFPEAISLNETVSKGIEAEINANPVQGLNLRASYSYNDSKITDAYSKTTNTQYDVLQDRRPEEAGPESIYNFWADYKFESSNNTFFQNLGIGAGFNGTSEHLTVNNGVVGVFKLPAYTIYNASVYYDANKFRVGFKVNNLTNETYYKGWSTVNAQAPRAFLGTVVYKF